MPGPDRDFEAELRRQWDEEDVQQDQRTERTELSSLQLSEAAPAPLSTDSPEPLRIVEMDPQDRPRERLLRMGADALSNAELLAVLLNTGQPREDALQTARRLLRDRGLVGLLRSDVHELMRFPGLGEAKAARVKAAIQLAARGMADDEWPAREPFRSAKQVFDRFRALLGDLVQEEVWVLVLDQQHCLIREERLYKGMVHGASVRVAEMLRPVIVHQGPSMIVVHNHPSGSSQPSAPDRTMTSDLWSAAQTMGISLIDHVIVTRSDFSSMAQLGLLGEGR